MLDRYSSKQGYIQETIHKEEESHPNESDERVDVLKINDCSGLNSRKNSADRIMEGSKDEVDDNPMQFRTVDYKQMCSKREWKIEYL